MFSTSHDREAGHAGHAGHAAGGSNALGGSSGDLSENRSIFYPIKMGTLWDTMGHSLWDFIKDTFI